MPSKNELRLRKATDIKREHAIFELLADGEVILDVGYSDTGTFEVCFSQPIVGNALSWEQLREWIEEGRRMADQDRA
jgi:hypothetical protein